MSKEGKITLAAIISVGLLLALMLAAGFHWI